MSGNRPSTADKRKTFRKLHEAGCFVIPNPWNVGSARYLQGLGFPALATTSSGYAHSQGFADGALSLEQVLEHFREIADATDVPLNADFEDGLADDLDGLAENVTRCIATGVAGLSIEDSPNDGRTPLYDLDTAVTRIKTARAAIDRAGGEVVFTGAGGKFYSRRARSRRRHPQAQSLCRGRRRLPLCAGHQHARADRSGGQGGGAEADKFSQQRRVRLHGERPRGNGRAPDQRRRLARPRRHARLHPHRDRDRQGRQIRRLRRADLQPRAEQVLSAKIARSFRHDRLRTSPGNRPAGRASGGRSNAGAAARSGDSEGPLRPARETRLPNTPRICG